MVKKTSKKQDKKFKSSRKFGISNYPIGDFLIKLKNSCMARKKVFVTSSSKFVLEVARLLEKEGYFDEVKVDGGSLRAQIAYQKKEPVLENICLVSKPGLRVYMGVDDIEAKKGPSFFIVSTPQGIMTSRLAIKKRLGGEIIAEVF